MADYTACSVGSCARHQRCMYLNHPRCPLKTNAAVEALKAKQPKYLAAWADEANEAATRSLHDPGWRGEL